MNTIVFDAYINDRHLCCNKSTDLFVFYTCKLHIHAVMNWAKITLDLFDVSGDLMKEYSDMNEECW